MAIIKKLAKKYYNTPYKSTNKRGTNIKTVLEVKYYKSKKGYYTRMFDMFGRKYFSNLTDFKTYVNTMSNLPKRYVRR